MTSTGTKSQRLRVAHLNPRLPTAFSLSPDAAARNAIMADLGLLGLGKLDFAGEIRAEGDDSWLLDGELRASIVQPCIVTLQPVASEISQPVQRRYVPDLRLPEGEEVEMPDDNIEILGQFIDLEAVLIEELTLAMPEYPRADGAELQQSEQPVAETRRPFAGLDKLLKRDES